jgi:hypothetical protein
MTINKGITLETYIEIEQSVVEVRAYYYWENAGRPEGRSEEFYFNAMNDMFAEAQQSILAMKEQQNRENANWSIDIVDSDDSWFKDIEQSMPELKTMRFRNVNQKISWMFNNLKKFKGIPEVTQNINSSPVCKQAIQIEEEPVPISDTLESELKYEEAIIEPMVSISQPMHQEIIEGNTYSHLYDADGQVKLTLPESKITERNENMTIGKIVNELLNQKEEKEMEVAILN